MKGFDGFFGFAQAMSPLGNAPAEDCARYCISLFSDLTKFVTMQNLFHDGGFSTTGVTPEVMAKFVGGESTHFALPEGTSFVTSESMRSVFLSLTLILLTVAAQGQGGKAFLKEGDALRRTNDLDKALERYSLAIDVEPKLIKAYQARAEVNTLLGNKPAVVIDLARVVELDPGEPADGCSSVSRDRQCKRRPSFL